MWLLKRIPSLIPLAAVTLLLSLSQETVIEGKRLARLFQDGNFKEAYEGYRKRLLDGISLPEEFQSDLDQAVRCLAQLGRENELDELLEETIGRWPNNWRALWAAGRSYHQLNHSGFLISGEFRRGQHRGGGEYVQSLFRDRVRALQLLSAAVEQTPGNAEAALLGRLYLDLGDALLASGQGYEAWRLQALTDLSNLPDFEPGYRGRYGRSGTFAPVDADGRPVLHGLPESFASARSDGERWRFALHRASELSAQHGFIARWRRAEFLQSQFSVTSLGSLQMLDPSSGQDLSAGPYALESLGEHETIARLATGIRRFDLPDEFNHIRLYRDLAESEGSPFGDQALERLARIFENRRQLGKAAVIWKQLADREKDLRTRERYLAEYRQIVGNWGEFHPVTSQPARRGATIGFRFRNGRKVKFQAHAVKLDLLLDDVRNYLRSNPGRVDRQKIEVSSLGYRLVTENQARYVGDQVAEWELALEPAADHHEQRIRVATPLQSAGAYLLTSSMGNGNTSKIVLWVADTVIARKTLQDQSWYYVADAVTGTPIEGAKVEFFGYRSVRLKTNQYSVTTSEFADHTDRHGQILLPLKEQERAQTWLAIARTDTGRLAYLGFHGAWFRSYENSRKPQRTIFTITDRPVYRPDQTVHFKSWLGTPRYDSDEPSEFAGRKVELEIKNPRDESVLKRSIVCDAYGGFDGSLVLETAAVLGVYSIHIDSSQAGNFRVEEYKQPEFEVSLETPDRPVLLGEKLPVKVQARYYFGAPVAHGTVKYQVLRSTAQRSWFPGAPWDWLYGKGYWWFGSDSSWYPGFGRWGCLPPLPPWWGGSNEQPEVVAEGEAELLPDGTFRFEIDSGPAKALLGDRDHQYRITAEVTDQSRRTIVGQGTVTATREPFQITVWTDSGHYQVGDAIVAHAAARTLDGKPVTGTGNFNLYRIRYEKNLPKEQLVRTQLAEFDAEGRCTIRLEAARAGQYRLAFTQRDDRGRSVEGAALLTVRGQGAVAADFRYGAIELTTDQREYKPGDKLKLLISTARPDSVVALFLRPVNGVYQPPQILQLRANSRIVELEVTRSDMPNFFVEALSISDGELLTASRMIAVPPEQRILKVEIQAAAAEVRPGQTTKVSLQLTDQHGEPVVGSTVVSIYDRALEYISGGSNVGAIRERFWSWRRHHQPHTESSLFRSTYQVTPPGEDSMNRIGLFGGLASPEMSRGDWESDFGDETRGAFKKMRSLGYLGESGGPGAPPASMEVSRAGLLSDDFDGGDDGGAAHEVAATVRREFAETALWVGSLETDEQGRAELSVTMPDNLTSWRIRAWSLDHGFRVGEGEGSLVTSKKLLLRMQAPRFFTEKDEVVLSANVHNYLETDKQVRVILELEGACLRPLSDAQQTVAIAAGGEARIDFRVRAEREGEAVLRMQALTDEESDAVEMRFPVHVHGLLKLEAVSGALRPDDQRQLVQFKIPTERRISESRLELRYSPTLAGAMVDALPYLVEYPYGCTEQTLNRFLPTVITQKILIDMGLDLAAIREKRTNLNAQEVGDDAERAKQWQRFDRNPVFDPKIVHDMADQGLRRLQEMQLSDGGWGWFSGYGERSWPHTTATVVHGLQVAQANDLALLTGVLERGVAWLEGYQQSELQKLRNRASKTRPYKSSVSNLDALAFSVLVDAGRPNDGMEEFLYEERAKLSLYSQALFGLALHKLERTDRLKMILQNLTQYLEQDDTNQTAWLRLPAEGYWYWYRSEYEAQACYLKLLARTDPRGDVASRLVKYLLNNRRFGGRWKSTRDTALAIEALAEYLKASGESRPDLTVEVILDGQQKKQIRITPENLFSFDNRFVLEGEAVTGGEHTLEIRRQGTGPVYFNLYSSYFSLEDSITRTGLELQVDRKIYRLVREQAEDQTAGSSGQVLDQQVEQYRREQLENLSEVSSGDLIEVELSIQSKNDYEYVIIEDFKPAGFEAIDLQSGYSNDGLGAYREFRDRTVSFFVRELMRGEHSIKYRLRAEIPGRFSALPARVSAMYAPELIGNSNELKVVINDKE